MQNGDSQSNKKSFIVKKKSHKSHQKMTDLTADQRYIMTFDTKAAATQLEDMHAEIT